MVLFNFFHFSFFSEAVLLRFSYKKVLVKISQNSQENDCARVLFLIMLQVKRLRTTAFYFSLYWVCLETL